MTGEVRRAVLRIIMFATLTLPLAVAASDQHQNSPPPGGGAPHQGGEPAHHRHVVPEFDPAALGIVGALVAGGAVLVARRARR